MLVAMLWCFAPASAQATSYVGRQSDAAHGVVKLSVSGGRVTAREIAVDCPGPGSALPGQGSGELSKGRFSVRISYRFFSKGHSSRPVRLWATLTGAIHGASIAGELDLAKAGACQGARYRATASSRAAHSTVTNSAVAGGETSEAATNEGSGPNTTAGLPPYPEEGSHEAEFDAAWESAIEGLCHPGASRAAEQAQIAEVGPCAGIASAEDVAFSQVQ
jgi:hypothetical protein